MTETTSSTADSQVEPPKPKSDQTSAAEIPICSVCGSDRIVRDAWVAWDTETKDWQPTTVFDHVYCLSCERESSIEWRSTALTKTERIRMLNDALRTGRRSDGTVLVTVGVNGLGPQFVAEAREAIAAFDDFNADNHPHREHDFGALTVQNEKLFFKIDYYDLDMSMHSPDASDPSVTKRVLTIMLASEYWPLPHPLSQGGVFHVCKHLPRRRCHSQQSRTMSAFPPTLVARTYIRNRQKCAKERTRSRGRGAGFEVGG